MIKTKMSLIAAVAVVVGSCNSGSDSFDQKIAAKEDTASMPKIEISEATLNDIIQSIPSPIEMSALIKESGAPYDHTILNAPENADNYSTNYKKAFALGIYSADLGYLNIYEKSFATIDYLGSIKKLANGINVGQFMDMELLKKLAANNKNVDSLMYISTSSFNKMDSYLREQKRGNLSVLIISGAWLEGLYIAAEVAKVSSKKELTERIGEQKINMDNIMLILNAYKTDKYFGNIALEFQKLKDIYDQVTITTEYHEPITKEVNGQLVIEDNSKSTVNITDQQLKNIIATTGEIRKQLTQ